MSTISLDVFDRTLQKTNMWLNQIMHGVGGSQCGPAFKVLAARVTDGEISDVEQVLPPK